MLGTVAVQQLGEAQAGQPSDPTSQTNHHPAATGDESSAISTGFVSLDRDFKVEVRLGDLNALPVDKVDLLVLKQAGVISQLARSAKVILAGSIEKAVKVSGLGVTKGAKAAIEAAGGSVESVN